MDNENIENMEKQARINALKIALRQTDSQAIAHLESAVGAILQMMKPAQRASVLLALAEYEQLSPEAFETLRLCGETDDGAKSQRQAWREELVALEAQSQTAYVESETR